MPIIVAIEYGNRLGDVDPKKLEKGKSPGAVVDAVDQNRETKDCRPTDMSIWKFLFLAKLTRTG
jgi:hypothetical protein